MRALVVDDSKAMRMIIGRTVKGLGYEVVEGCNGLDAMERLKDSGPFDVALVDWNMPEMNGYQLASIVKTKHPEIKILFASGFADNRHEDMSDENSNKNLLQKPYNSTSLLQKVYDLLQ